MTDNQVLADIPLHLRKPRLRRSEAAEYLLRAHGLPVAAATLAKYASVGGGPGYQKCGVTPLYPIQELDAWAIDKLGRLMRSSSEVHS